MNLKEQLQFEKMEGNTPDFICHWCGTDQSNEGWQAAELRPFKSESSGVMIVACSYACKQNLLHHKNTELGLVGMVLHIQESANGREVLKEDYQEHFNKLLQQI